MEQALAQADCDPEGKELKREIVRFLSAIRVILSLPIPVPPTDQPQFPILQAALNTCNTSLSNILYRHDASIPDPAFYQLANLSTHTSRKALRLLKQWEIRDNAMRGAAANLRTKAPILFRRFERA